MNRTRSAWVLTALMCAALLAGCGSSSSTPAASTSSATTPAGAATTPTTPAASTTQTAAPPTGAAADQIAAAACKSSEARAKLPANLKARVEAICHDYAGGNEAKAREDAKKACTEAVEAIPGDSTAKQQALAHCASSQ